MRFGIVAVVLALVANHAHAEPGVGQRAMSVIDAQVAALKKDRAGRAEFLATLDPQCTFVSSAIVPCDQIGSYIDELTGEVPPPNETATVASLRTDNFDVNGNSSMAWFVVDYQITRKPAGAGSGRGSTTTFRVAELLAADRGWKAVAVFVDRPTKADVWEKRGEYTVAKIGKPKAAIGELGKIAQSPAEIAKRFSTSGTGFAFGTSEAERFKTHDAIERALAQWSKLTLAPGGMSREDEGAGWGYAATDVIAKVGNKELPMRVLVFASGVPLAYSIDGVAYARAH